MDVANPASSRAVLIGSSAYDKLTALPSVLANLDDLRDALTNADIWGLPPANITVIADATSRVTIYEALRDAAAATQPDGLLLYYYAGHGLIDAGDLMLGLPDTDPQHPDEQTLPYAKLREATRQSSASRRVIILDCCFAGRAGQEVLSAADAVRRLGHHDAEDACLLLAAGANRAASAPLRDRNTAFTGALLDLLANGSELSDPVLTIRTIADQVTQQLLAGGHERPELRLSNRAADIPLARNIRIRRRELTGSVLEAGKDVTDPELRGIRMLVLRHNDTGAIGVRLNRPADTLPESLNGWQAKITPPKRLFDGGPIARDAFIALVRIKTGMDNPIRFTEIKGNLGSLPLSDSQPSVGECIADLRVFVGYLGWGPGGLEQLINDGTLNVADVFAPRVTFARESPP
jgi:putative transcriptional regulator